MWPLSWRVPARVPGRPGSTWQEGEAHLPVTTQGWCGTEGPAAAASTPGRVPLLQSLSPHGWGEGGGPSHGPGSHNGVWPHRHADKMVAPKQTGNVYNLASKAKQAKVEAEARLPRGDPPASQYAREDRVLSLAGHEGHARQGLGDTHHAGQGSNHHGHHRRKSQCRSAWARKAESLSSCWGDCEVVEMAGPREGSHVSPPNGKQVFKTDAHSSTVSCSQKVRATQMCTS